MIFQKNINQVQNIIYILDYYEDAYADNLFVEY